MLVKLVSSENIAVIVVLVAYGSKLNGGELSHLIPFIEKKQKILTLSHPATLLQCTPSSTRQLFRLKMKGGALGTMTYNPYHTEVKSLHQPKQSTTEDEPQKGSILRQRPSVRF